MFRTNLRVTLCAVALAMVWSVTAAGDIIYNNGGPDIAQGVVWSESYGQIVADNFSLQQGASSIGDIHWWGGYQNADLTPGSVFDDDFTIWILADSSGPSGVPLHTLAGLTVTRESTALVTYDGVPLYFYSLVLGTPIDLTPGTAYWLAIFNPSPYISSPDILGINNNSGNGGSTHWGWQNTNYVGFYSTLTFDYGSSWIQPGVGEMAFYLTGDAAPVPEPATMTLLGLGLAGLAARRLRKRA